LRNIASFDKISTMMNDDLRLDEAGERLIKGFEGLKLKAYHCPANKLTIGWGHTNDHGRQFGPEAVWTEAEAEAAFKEDMFGFECHVRSLVRVKLSQGQYNALVSFAYNCGWQSLAKSTLLTRLNRGDYAGASREFGKWTHARGKVMPGLVRRRAAEAAMFSDSGGVADGEDMPQAVDRPTVPAIGTAPAGISAGACSAAAVVVAAKFKSFDVSMLTDPVVLICAAALVAVGVTYFAYYKLHHEVHG
jgi:lysozyme